MKTRILITSVILIFTVLVFIGNYAIGEDEYVLTENEEIYSTWVNTSYRPGTGEGSYWAWKPQKIIYKPDGTIESYSAARDIAHFTGKYNIIAKWTDSEGNIFYKIITKWGDKTYGQTTLYEFQMISNSGLTWEYITSLDDYATEIDPNHPDYHIYYRQ
jgi:hypothetical protein